MGVAKFEQGAKNVDVVEVEHWIYGVVPGVGYTTKAVSRGLSVSLYESYLRGHYTPIRPAAVQSEGAVDLQMIHPVRSGEEILLSRLSRGPPDEAGRPTFTNHTAIVPTNVLRAGRITLDAVARAMAAFDKADGDVQGDMGLLGLAARSQGESGMSFGAGIHKYVSLSALETLTTRMMADPRSRTLLLSRDSTPETRNKTLCNLVEVLNWGCGLPLFSAISDAPTASALNFFNVVVAARGVRADSSWALLETSLGTPVLPRIPGQDQVYETLAAAFHQSRALPSAR